MGNIFLDVTVHNFTLLNPNPGGLVANMTSKPKKCCEKFIIHKSKLKIICIPP